MMRAAEVWGERWSACESSLSRRYMETVVAKQSLVILAADRYTMAGLSELLEDVSDHVVALKTHVDLVEDWSASAWSEFVGRAAAADMLIFEDRKHGDIGKIARDQMGGAYESRNWADLMTAHLISGPSVLDGMAEAWKSVGLTCWKSRDIRPRWWRWDSSTPPVSDSSVTVLDPMNWRNFASWLERGG